MQEARRNAARNICGRGKKRTPYTGCPEVSPLESTHGKRGGRRGIRNRFPPRRRDDYRYRRREISRHTFGVRFRRRDVTDTRDATTPRSLSTNVRHRRRRRHCRCRRGTPIGAEGRASRDMTRRKL